MAVIDGADPFQKILGLLNEIDAAILIKVPEYGRTEGQTDQRAVAKRLRNPKKQAEQRQPKKRFGIQRQGEAVAHHGAETEHAQLQNHEIRKTVEVSVHCQRTSPAEIVKIQRAPVASKPQGSRSGHERIDATESSASSSLPTG